MLALERCEQKGALNAAGKETMDSTVSRALKHLTSRSEVSPSPAGPDNDASARTWLANAIAELPARERLALALCYQEGLSCEEMAVVLGLAADEAEQLHTRALSHLASRIADNE
jgi:RNA polymerase sigma factor for flagellar operon FliA